MPFFFNVFFGFFHLQKSTTPPQCALSRTASWSPNNVQEFGGGAFNNIAESLNALVWSLNLGLSYFLFLFIGFLSS